jgi:hypothetical protein
MSSAIGRLIRERWRRVFLLLAGSAAWCSRQIPEACQARSNSPQGLSDIGKQFLAGHWLVEGSEHTSCSACAARRIAPPRNYDQQFRCCIVSLGEIIKIANRGERSLLLMSLFPARDHWTTQCGQGCFSPFNGSLAVGLEREPGGVSSRRRENSAAGGYAYTRPSRSSSLVARPRPIRGRLQ